MIAWSESTMIGRSMGIDVAWGDTSKFAIVTTQYRNRKVEVFYAESFEKPQMNEIINHIMQLKQRHHITRISDLGIDCTIDLQGDSYTHIHQGEYPGHCSCLFAKHASDNCISLLTNYRLR